jgi:L-iditol 2-dehydrogenase
MYTYRNGGDGGGNSGHEAVGVVADKGEGVEGIAIGQRVGVSTVVGCGHCKECEAGRYTWCDHRSYYGNMHAEYFVAAARGCHPLPDDVPWDVGVLITGDGLGVPIHSSHKIDAKPGSTIVVCGLGPIGLGNILIQKNLGMKVLAVDRAAARLDLAERLGAIPVASDANTLKQIKHLTNGYGAEVCIEAAGTPDAVRFCFDACRKGGMVIFNGEQSSIELSPSEDFIRRDIHAVGSWFYHFNEFPEMLALFRAGLPISSLITHRYPISQASEAFCTMDAGISGKIILDYTQ